ncbi:MAG: cupin domain-containing protein [Kiloniellales bacterium]|jgi:anti-sigma factor ChrR (cupin superfamily)|nr:cupin domain-containing protein [Kiloniellales bacterium]
MQSLNTDFTRRVVMHTAEMDWQASPSPTVWRKRLDLIDGEFSRVTSVVRYAPDSSFHTHGHPAGEEILVLEGVFSDEHGDYPAGSYLLNPKGFRHTPFSREGCVLFVKLCQYGGDGRDKIAVDTGAEPWMAGDRPGQEVLPLYSDIAWPETMCLERLAPGTALPRDVAPGGKEVFVLEGRLEDEDGSYGPGSWLRLPPGEGHAPRSDEGCTYYVKRGHLSDMVSDGQGRAAGR